MQTITRSNSSTSSTRRLTDKWVFILTVSAFAVSVLISWFQG